MINRTLITTLLLLMISAVIKAHYAAIKLLLLAGAGVAGLYMIHLLAQDYNKYQANRPKLLGGFLSKRSIPDDFNYEREVKFSEIEKAALENFEMFPEESVKRIKTDGQHHNNNIPQFEMILRFDPLGCARRYVCTISTKSTKKLSQAEKNILDMFRRTPRSGNIDAGQQAFREAIELGRMTRDPDACTSQYPKCIFSISQMLKLIGIS